MLQMIEELNNGDDYIPLYINVEAGQACRNDIKELNRTIINEQSNLSMIVINHQPWHQTRNNQDMKFEEIVINSFVSYSKLWYIIIITGELHKEIN